MSAPVLFVIARDLSEMEILASVDESEIGLIHQGQEVEFTVQAYPEKTFQGRVSQVRLQSTVVENVVTYGVVVSVDNSDGSLLPGMTATVEFIVARAEDVLKVSNSALRFQPTQAMREELAAVQEKRFPTAGAVQAARAVAPTGGTRVSRDDAGGAFGGAAGGSEGSAAGSRDTGARSAGAQSSFLYFLDGNGKLAATRVETGITDRQNTVVSSPELFEGMQVIAAVGSGTVTANAGTAASNPFQSQSGSRRSGPPMM
jgi:HlyD family secretion protein